MSDRRDQRQEADLSVFHEYVALILRRSTVVLIVATLCVWTADASWGRGLALGGVFSLLRFRLRANRLLKLRQSNAARGAFLNALLILALTGGIFAAAAMKTSISLPATVVGVFLTNIMVVLEQAVPWLRQDVQTEAGSTR